MSRPKVLYIVGNGFSGSTLIDLILGSHSRAVGLGEVRDLDRMLDGELDCACGAPRGECVFWRPILEDWSGGDAGLRLAPDDEDRARAAARYGRLYEAVARVTGAEVVIDSSKRLACAQLVASASGADVAFIHLIRDGRGVAYSAMSRGLSWVYYSAFWARANRDIRQWLRAPGAPPGGEVRYEDFCADPECALRPLLGTLGLAWEPVMLEHWRKPRHNVSGNRIRSDRSPRPITLDDRWRENVTPEMEAVFARVAGAALAEFGYA